MTTGAEKQGGSAAVDVDGLGKQYLGTHALAPLDIEVARGERVTLIGHNGSGKTTLIKILAGTLEPSEGSALVMGHPIGSIEARAAVSYIPDQPVFYDDLSVWEHLEFTARLHSTADWEQHAVDLLESLGLSHRSDDLPSTFSRGLQQKAGVAIAFVRPFDLLLVDEPFVGLDPVGRATLLELLAETHRDGAAMLIATHELSTARDGDRVMALGAGELIYDGAPAEADLPALTEGIIPPSVDEPT
jgi:ABC-2 type transport system ATP-binding protein